MKLKKVRREIVVRYIYIEAEQKMSYEEQLSAFIYKVGKLLQELAKLVDC